MIYLELINEILLYSVCKEICDWHDDYFMWRCCVFFQIHFRGMQGVNVNMSNSDVMYLFSDMFLHYCLDHKQK